MKKLSISIYPLFLVLVMSCSSQLKGPVYMSDKDFVEHERKYSPDKSMLILNYGIDIGAFGYGSPGKAVLRNEDVSKNLRGFDLPPNLIDVEWVDNHTISAGIDIIPSIRSGERLEIKDTEVNGVHVKISPVDYIQETSQLKIEHRETSPNGQFELIAYRYYYKTDRSFIHVSVVKVGEAVPKYGNYFIADRHSDRILDGKWSDKNTLIFYSNSNDSEYIKYFLVHKRPNIGFEIVTDDANFGKRYLWMSNG